jgi:MFS family permease
MATAESEPVKPPSNFAILKLRNFRYYWSATIFSIIGEHIEGVIRNWLIWELTHSVFWLLFMVFMHWVPFALLSIPAGSIAERVNRQQLILWAEIGTCLAAFGMFATTYAGVMNQYWMGGLLILHSVAGALSNPCRQLFLHDMVGREYLLSGVALTSSLRFATQSIGKPVGGLILITLGAATGFLVNGLAYLPLILVLFSVIRVNQQEVTRPRNSVAEFKEGVAHVTKDKSMLAALCIAIAPSIFVGNGFDPFLVVYADTIFKVGATGYTALITSIGIGALAGVLILGWLGNVRWKGMMLIISVLGWCASIVAFAFSRSLTPALVFLFVFGLFQVIQNSSATAMLLENAPSDMRGRIMGLFNFGRLGLRVLNGPFLTLVNSAVLLTTTGLFLSNALTLTGAATTIVLVTIGATILAPGVKKQE